MQPRPPPRWRGRGGGDAARPVQRRFISQVVREQIRTKAVFRCATEQVLVWGKTTPAERHELSSRLQLVCDTSEARLKVEFSEHDTPAHAAISKAVARKTDANLDPARKDMAAEDGEVKILFY